MSDWQPTASVDALRLRAAFNRLVREFFHARGVLEVETPVLSLAGNTEPNIASFSLEFSGRTDGAPRTRWLRTSPEFALKRLLAAGVGDCYELGRVFRDGEAGGDAEADPLYDQAVDIVLKNKRASISLVQRHLRIGYNRSARLIEAMEKAGLVSAMDGRGGREVIARKEEN